MSSESPHEHYRFVEELPQPLVERRTRAANFADALRQDPSKWGIWPNPLKTKKSANAMASAIRSGRLTCFPAGRFAAVERNGSLYVRYLGEMPDRRDCACECRARSADRLGSAIQLLSRRSGGQHAG